MTMFLLEMIVLNTRSKPEMTTAHTAPVSISQAKVYKNDTQSINAVTYFELGLSGHP